MRTLLKNTIGKPIWFRLNNGKTMSISPPTWAAEVSENEVATNTSIKKLIARQEVCVVKVPDSTPRAPHKDGKKIQNTKPAKSSTPG